MKMNENSYTDRYLEAVSRIIGELDRLKIAQMISLLKQIRNDGGRLFILGVGGSAGNASHAVNDFRKIAHIEAYAPTDNVSELTARVNDEGWHTVFIEWLKMSKLKDLDGILVFSVGGGNLEMQISPNLVEALRYARKIGSKILGVVGRDGGYTAAVADACLIIPPISDMITPLTEAFQAVIFHLLVSHPEMKINETKWESIK